MAANTLEPTDQQFLARLNRLGEATVQKLCAELRVTATAIRQRLSRLLNAKLVERETVPAERGRPHHVYRVTSAGRRHLGNDYGELVRLMWREITQLEDEATRARLFSRLRSALVERYGEVRIRATLDDRVRGLQQALDRQGFQVDIDEARLDGEMLPILREHCCPYPDLAVEDSSICNLEQSVFEEVLGVPVALTKCRRDGDTCCEFAPQMSEAAPGPKRPSVAVNVGA